MASPNPLLDPGALTALVSGLAQQSTPMGLPAPSGVPVQPQQAAPPLDPVAVMQMLRGTMGGPQPPIPTAQAPVPFPTGPGMPTPLFSGETPPLGIFEGARAEMARIAAEAEAERQRRRNQRPGSGEGDGPSFGGGGDFPNAPPGGSGPI